MIVLIENNSPFFDVQTAKENFELHKKELDDENGFACLLRDSRFFNVYNHGYVGSVFVYEGVDGRFYIGGYAMRHCHNEVVEAIRQVSDMYPKVFAHTRHLNAVIALKKAGFKWYNRKKKLLRKLNFKEKKHVK